MGQRVIRLFTKRLFKKVDATLQTLFGALVPVIASSEVVLIRRDILPRVFCDSVNARGTNGDLESLYDRLRDLILNLENIHKKAIVSLRPKRIPAFCIDKLHHDADLVA